MGAPKTVKVEHDGQIAIATGRSRKEKNWKNREMLWSQLVGKLSRTTRTRESFRGYAKLPKTQRDEIKDVGGFVGGTLKGGRRKLDNVVWRQIITLDADFVKGDLWAGVEVIFGHGCAMYSTHSHQPGDPRLRLVIPLSRPVSPDEYQAVGRRIAADLGIDFFDDTTYQPHRLMYWPSTAADGEYIFKVLDEPWVDPDEVLARYPDWRDPSYWPESSRTKAQRQKLADKQGDPHEKAGVIGGFCRTYSVEDAIEKFLGGIYERLDGGRYTYIAGTSVGGLVVYDNGKFAYSHHGTDPISGQLVNTFDLVRLHKFGIKDGDAELGTPVTRLPSYKAMVEFARKDDAVKLSMGEERLAEAGVDFGEDTGWLKELETDRKGEVVASVANLVTILQKDPNLQNIGFDAHRGVRALTGPVSWRELEGGMSDWTDSDDADLRVYLEQVYKIWSPGRTDDALSSVCRERAFHPIIDYLENLPDWDGVPRLETLLVDTLGADDNPYVRAVTRKTLVAAIARVFEPGIKFDQMLVLNGPQGKGKSTLFVILGGVWFNDSLTMSDMRDKTGAEKLQGYWIIEVGEMTGMRKVEVESVKSFISRQYDVYRQAYGRHTQRHPRQCIIVGSTNSTSGFLRDGTGNRRFWPVEVKGVDPDKAPWNLTKKEVGQIWAEALYLYRAGEELYLKGELAEAAVEAQKNAMEQDERLGMVQEFLDTLLPGGWEEMDLYQRREYLHGTDFGKPAEGTVVRDRVCIAEIWCECFRKDLANMRRMDMDELHNLMSQIEGWGRYQGNKSGKLKFGKIYGVQRAYYRENLE